MELLLGRRPPIHSRPVFSEKPPGTLRRYWIWRWPTRSGVCARSTRLPTNAARGLSGTWALFPSVAIRTPRSWTGSGSCDRISRRTTPPISRWRRRSVRRWSRGIGDSLGRAGTGRELISSSARPVRAGVSPDSQDRPYHRRPRGGCRPAAETRQRGDSVSQPRSAGAGVVLQLSPAPLVQGVPSRHFHKEPN